MSHLSTTVTHNEYTSFPTDERTFTDPNSFNFLAALKNGFTIPTKSKQLWAWALFTVLGLALSFGCFATVVFAANASSTANPGSTYAIIGNILALIAILFGLYFLIGMTQGYIRGTHSGSPKFGDLFISNPTTLMRGFGASIILGFIAMVMVIPMLVLNTLAILVGVPVSQTVSIAIMVIAATITALLRIFFAYTIYAIVDSNTRVLDAFILSLKIVSKNFFSSLMLFITTTILLVAPLALIAYIPVNTIDNVSDGFATALWIVAGAVAALLFPVLQVAYVYAYRKSTFGTDSDIVDTEDVPAEADSRHGYEDDVADEDVANNDEVLDTASGTNSGDVKVDTTEVSDTRLESSEAKST